MNFILFEKDVLLKYCIFVNHSPYDTQNSFSALKFSDALISEGHFLNSVFFYNEGIYNGNLMVLQERDEVNFVSRWKNIKKKSGCKLNICISSANKRGLFDKKTVEYSKKFNINLDKYFNLTSLVDFSKSVFFCDRLIQF